MRKGAIDLHGHSHGRLKEATRQYDVGVDVLDYGPVTLATILASRGRGKQRPKATKASRTES
jgi:calcineurin-like phosphoesterase family protein